MPSDLLELIILAAITGFIIFKLYTTLGQKVGFEPSPQAKPLESVDNSDIKAEGGLILEEDPMEAALSTSLKTAITEIRTFDAGFNVKTFLKGASQAFDLILEAFAQGDLQMLKTLTNTEVFEEFKTSIEERQKHGEVLETTLVKVESVDLTEAEIQKQTARLTVTFQTEQIHVTRDQHGQIMDGHPQQIEQLTDTWVFERLLSSRNPNWTLVKTVL